MKVLCRNENSSCVLTPDSFDINYSVIQIKELEQGSFYENRTSVCEIFFIISGTGILNTHIVQDFILEERTAILLPIGCNYTLHTTENLKVIIYKIDNNIRLCDSYTFENILEATNEHDDSFKSLEINDKLWAFSANLMSYIDDGLCCDHFLRMKITEMLYIFRAYYPEKVISRFFNPLITKDTKFSNFIYDNWNKVKNLDELADMYNLSLSGFTKKFKKVFGIAPYKWIMNKKGEMIYNDLCSSDKSIKQLSIDYNFCSVQHFCDYCKKKFGMPPGKIKQGAR